MRLIVQDGGAIAFRASNSKANLRLCTLSSNEEEGVRRHADQEQCRKDLCMLQSLLCSLVGACM